MSDISQIKKDVERYKKEEEDAEHTISKKESEMRHLDSDISDLNEKLKRAKRKQEELTHDLEKAEREDKDKNKDKKK